MNLKNLMMWGVIVLLVVGLFQLFQNPKNSVTSDKVAETTKTVESVSSAFDELFNQNA